MTDPLDSKDDVIDHGPEVTASDFGRSVAAAILYLLLAALVLAAALIAPAYSNIHHLAEQDRAEKTEQAR